MPGRRVVLAIGEYYHIFNRGNAYQPIFLGTRDYRRFLETIGYYQFISPSLRLSKYLLLPKENRNQLMKSLIQKGNYLIDLICFCLMPNHYHLLLKQNGKDGISKFIGQLQNSYTKYFNVKRKRIGSVFQGQFKAVRIETDEQLLHLSRYIHLNPYSSFIVRSLEKLKEYPWASLPDYLGQESYFFLKKEILSDFFKDAHDHEKFVFDQADYQRRLEEIKHLAFDH